MAKLSVEKRLLQAQSLMRKGALRDAQHAAQSVLQDFPANKKAKKLLSKIDQARTAGPVATPRAEQEKIAHLVRLFESGDALAAADLASRYAKQFPRSAMVWNVAAAANKMLERTETAIECFERVVQINPTDVDAHFNLGVLLQEDGRLKVAADSYRRALALRPEDAEAQNNLGKALQDLGETRKAISHYEKAVECDPHYEQAFYNLGVARRVIGDLFGAIRAFKSSVALKPEDTKAYEQLGSVYLECSNFADAMAVFDAVLEIEPENPDLLHRLANILSADNRVKEAIAFLERATAIAPPDSDVHQAHSLLEPFEHGSPKLKELLSLYNSKKSEGKDVSFLCFALAQAYEELEEYETAFQFLEASNASRSAQLNYDLSQDVQLFANIRATDLTPVTEYSARRSEKFEPTPIFIVGMPRSGTTLTEQIISSHSQAYGAGEISLIGQFGLDLAQGKVEANEKELDVFTSIYAGYLTEMSNGEPFVIDKMPQNFRFIGLICELFPTARIIHTMRDARAVCWSNYKLNFSSPDLGYATNLDNTVEYYKRYRDMVAFWNRQYGDRIIDLDYDVLTRNQEQETRRLISELGLNWEDACLAPHENKRIPRTASAQQVKEKVYAGSSAKWRTYEPFLKGTFDSL